MNKLIYKDKEYNLDNIKQLPVNLSIITEVFENLAARYLWACSQINDYDAKKNLDKTFKVIKKDIGTMYKNIEKNYDVIK